jgi:hypothetical protein
MGLVGEKVKLATGGRSGGGRTWTVIVAVTVRFPDRPRIVTTYWFGGVVLVVEKVRNDDCVAPDVNARLLGSKTTVGEMNGVGNTVAVRKTVPTNPFIELM